MFHNYIKNYFIQNEKKKTKNTRNFYKVSKILECLLILEIYH